MWRGREAATISKRTPPLDERITVNDSSPCSGWFDNVP
jgi:hypothetical protein